MDIEVAQNATVNLLCEERESCDSLSMNVSSESNVHLWCENYFSCNAMRLNASSFDNTSVNITCDGPPLMKGLRVTIWMSLEVPIRRSMFGVLRVQKHVECQILSVVQIRQLTWWVPGPINANSIGSCYAATIIGGNGSDINVSCTGYANCDGLLIDGRDAASLRMRNCTGNVSCETLTVYCPQHRNGEKMCIFEGGNNLQFWNLYAMNSWEDIEFISYVSPIKCGSIEWGSKMPCGTDNYNESCVFAGSIARERWECWARDNSSECNVEQRAVSSTDCSVPSPSPSKHHLKTQEIVIIVVCTLVVVGVTAVVFWWFLTRKKDRNVTAGLVSMSDESDGFIQSQER